MRIKGPASSSPQPARIRHFFTKVAGISHLNPDGSSRQRIARQCQMLEKLELAHEDDNPHDANAIVVRRSTGEQLGYLPREVAERVAEAHRAKFNFGVFVSQVTGDPNEGDFTGVNLFIVQAAPEVSDEESVAYMNSVLPYLDIGGGFARAQVPQPRERLPLPMRLEFKFLLVGSIVLLCIGISLAALLVVILSLLR